jgi:hypothetical protein
MNMSRPELVWNLDIEIKGSVQEGLKREIKAEEAGRQEQW